ncbi:hypothetical protein SAMD00019534_031990 [Acytostelium subglobosum LB1]|uniref:hypothetical protein n=1 Tax=Acytostelium subglobosum LB1 TaxID=1410327 RepID=UPI000644DE06|nr:hypothetical protein SAMD00019534_031990 [Acytostelium subglobosum LB1]GAM20024.1 hypothetical protein SAMD00019534_031990 [Acytostelium subglobosum LB1]|eukprot:XP_012756786.1 hypothetical protein SAMD00019534_031990 [Acytostelium subglobosum LB1]
MSSKNNNNKGGGGGGMITDSRFKKAHNDPKFKLKRRADSAIQLDERFSKVMTSDRFNDKAPIDEYGRKLAKESSTTKKFKDNFKVKKDDKKKQQQPQNKKDDVKSDSRFSIPSKWKDLEEKDDEDAEEHEEKELVKKPKAAAKATTKKTQIVNKNKDEESEDDDSEEESDEEVADGDTEELVYGGFEYNDDTESSEEENDEDFLNQGQELDEVTLEEEDVPRGDATKRFAILNCDWDNIHSKDLYLILSSFLPKGGVLLSVTIYPSDFGLKQIEIEKRMGPSKDIFNHTRLKTPSEETDIQYDHKEDPDSLDGSGFNLVSLRKYELSKLKYYYAVAVFDRLESASVVYDECDGLEIEDTANALDLRFVPDEQEFTNPPRDTCTDMPETAPNLGFTTSVLKGTSVDFTWDVDKNRKKALTQNYKEDYDEDEVKLYLAEPETSSEEEEEDKNSRLRLRNKYKSLLLDDDEDGDNKLEEKDDLQVTFKTGLEDNDDDSSSDEDGLKVEFSDGEVQSSGDEEDDDVSDDDDDEGDDESDNAIDPQDEEWTKDIMNRGDDSDVDETAQEITIKTDLHKVGKNLLREKEKRENGTLWTEYMDKKRSKQNEKMKNKRLKAEEEEKKREEDEKKSRKGKKKPPTAEELKSKAELELLMMDENDGEKKKGFNKRMLERQVKVNTSTNPKKNKKRANDPEDTFKIDTKDPRFEKLYNASDFALDPTDPKFKPTNAVKDLLNEKKRRREEANKNGNGNNISNSSSAPVQVEKKQKSEADTFKSMAENIKKKAQLNKMKTTR